MVEGERWRRGEERRGGRERERERERNEEEIKSVPGDGDAASFGQLNGRERRIHGDSPVFTVVYTAMCKLEVS